MRRLLKSRKGSEALSTLVVGVTILVVVLISSNVASQMLRLQMAQAEFEEAKENMLLLADIVEEVGAKMYSSGYVKFNCRYGMLDFLRSFESFQLKLGDDVILEGSLSSLRYTCGLSFPIAEKYLRGCGYSIVIGEASPVVSVYTVLNTEGLPCVWLKALGLALDGDDPYELDIDKVIRLYESDLENLAGFSQLDLEAELTLQEIWFEPVNGLGGLKNGGFLLLAPPSLGCEPSLQRYERVYGDYQRDY